MGKNFQGRFPFVYKSGIYNKAMSMFQEMKYAEALKKLEEGFNCISLKGNFNNKIAQQRK